MHWTIEYYVKTDGRCPVREFIVEIEIAEERMKDYLLREAYMRNM